MKQILFKLKLHEVEEKFPQIQPMGFCFIGGERAICVTLSRGIIFIRCFCTCFRCVETLEALGEERCWEQIM